MQDQDIIDLYWKRDEQAIEESDRSYGPLCRDLSRRIVGNEPDAEECVNDTWLHTWNAIPPTRPFSLRAFLCRIVRDLSIDRYRRSHARRRASEAEISLDEVIDYIAVPDEAEPELPAMIEDFLDREEDLDRRLFAGRYFHAYSVKDLAKGYGLSPNAVSHRLGRTREKLRAYLNERGYQI